MAAMPKDKDLLIATGQSAEQTGNKALAAAAYRNLLAVDPGNQIATEGLQRLGER
jgi:predicted TPR repeat methyltransferase